MDHDERLAGPIDWTHLARQTGGDAAFAAEILGLFSAHAQKLAAALRAATEPKSWRDAAHGLKGSARGVGAFLLGQAAEAAEAVTPGSPAASEALARIERLLGEAIAAIAARADAAGSGRELGPAAGY